MKPAYYNEIDPDCVEWLKNLIAAGLIPDGEVDSRSIVDVGPDDLRGFGQKHFFAGIGGFAYACRLAGIPDDWDIATGGFPCQPFSVAGRRLAQSDGRHLWPELHRLVAQVRPAWFLGENVAGIVALALDGVLFDLETSGYACRAFVIPACAVDAPHRRERVWIAARDLANAGRVGRDRGEVTTAGGVDNGHDAGRAQGDGGAVGSGQDGGRGGALADTTRELLDGGGNSGAGRRREPTDGGGGSLGHSGGAGLSRGEFGGEPSAAECGEQARAAIAKSGSSPGGGGFWSDAGRIVGADGKARRIPQPGIRLLASRVSGRVARLRAAGNAICPQVAAEILKAMRAAA